MMLWYAVSFGEATMAQELLTNFPVGSYSPPNKATITKHSINA